MTAIRPTSCARGSRASRSTSPGKPRSATATTTSRTRRSSWRSKARRCRTITRASSRHAPQAQRSLIAQLLKMRNRAGAPMLGRYAAAAESGATLGPAARAHRDRLGRLERRAQALGEEERPGSNCPTPRAKSHSSPNATRPTSGRRDGGERAHFACSVCPGPSPANRGIPRVWRVRRGARAVPCGPFRDSRTGGDGVSLR